MLYVCRITINENFGKQNVIKNNHFCDVADFKMHGVSK